jgi:hypothetical protein
MRRAESDLTLDMTTPTSRDEVGAVMSRRNQLPATSAQQHLTVPGAALCVCRLAWPARAPDTARQGRPMLDLSEHC